MNLLLDSHVWLWLLSEPGRIRAATFEILQDPSQTLYVSAASLWELAIKVHIGKLTLPQPVLDLFRFSVSAHGVKGLQISPLHASEIENLKEDHHKDPFDRMLLVQAQIEKMALVTSDENILKYSGNFLQA